MCWFLARSRISSPAQASALPTVVHTASKAFPANGACSLPSESERRSHKAVKRVQPSAFLTFENKQQVRAATLSTGGNHARDKAANGPGPQHGLPRIRFRSRCRSPGKDAQGGARKNSTHRRELHHCLRRGRGGGWRQYRAAATGLFLRLHRVLTADPGCPVRAHDEGENRQGPDACNRARSSGRIGLATDDPRKLAGNRDPLGTRVQRAAGAIGRGYPKRREWMLRVAGAPESRACGAYGFCKRSSLQTAVTLEGSRSNNHRLAHM